MIENPKFISSEASVVHEIDRSIRNKAFDFEKKLSEKYLPASVISISDEVEDPEIPRIVFQSKHGFSKIIASQGRLKLTTKYDENFWESPLKVLSYLEERAKMITGLAKNVGKLKILYIGMSVKMLFESLENNLAEYLNDKFLRNKNSENLFILNFTFSLKYLEKFYLNIHIYNARNTELKEGRSILLNRRHVQSLSDMEQISQAIIVNLDFNNRLQYNNLSDYQFAENTVDELLELLKEYIDNKVVEILTKGIIIV